MTRSAAIATLALLVLLGRPAAFGQERWLTYRNERFGVAADYPDVFAIRDEPPANGDGQRFRTRDGRAELAISGAYNVLNETPRRMMESWREAGTTYTLAVADARSFTLSGTRDGRISYIRCRLSDREHGTFGCLDLKYPRSEARSWDAAVERMARSLRF